VGFGPPFFNPEAKVKNLLILIFAMCIYSCSTTLKESDDELAEDIGTFTYHGAGDITR